MSKISDALRRAQKEKQERSAGRIETAVSYSAGSIDNSAMKRLKRYIAFLDNGNNAQRAQESFRILRTNLYARSKPKSILITSPGESEGKTLVGLNLAVAVAQQGGRVLLVDAYVDNPQIASILGLENAPGLTEIISACGGDGDGVVQNTAIPNLWFVGTGYPMKNHTELLADDCMKRLIKKWEREYDAVIIDTSPILDDTEALVLAPMAGGVVFTARKERTYKDSVLDARRQLEKVNANVLGFVLTGVKSSIPGFIKRFVG